MTTPFKLSGILMLCLMTLFYSCKKTTKEEAITQHQGLATAAGQAEETGIAVTIGAAGGTLESTDGQLHISIPAGAVSGQTTFSIQRISNTNIAGIGAAYRLLPHGTRFSEPLTLTFKYDTTDLAGTALAAVGIAFQDDNGVWQGSGALADTSSGTLSITTTHFSDWSLFKSFAVIPVTASVAPGQNLSLHVVNFMSDEDLIPPVPGATKAIGPQQSMMNQYIKKWELGGAGTLQPNGSEATYTAPDAIPTQNPVAVSVTLEGPGKAKYLLVSNIYIGTEGVTFRIDNGPWRHGTIPIGGIVEAAGFHNLDAAIEPLNENETFGALSLKWSGYPSEGFLSWGTTMPWFNYSPTGSNVSYHQFMIVGSSVVPSPGGITFSQYTETAGGDIIGSFILEKAGRQTVTATGSTWAQVKIEGFFKTKRK
jgi:hypothetical protein